MPLVSAVFDALNMIVARRACRTRSGLTVQCGAAFYAAALLLLAVAALHLTGTVEITGPTLPSWG